MGTTLRGSTSKGTGSLILMSVPALFFYVFFFLTPVIASFAYSLTNFDGLNFDYDFVGLRNYRLMISDEAFIVSIKNTFVFALSVIILQNTAGFLIAIILHENLRFRSLYRSLLFLPSLITSVIVAYLWTYMYAGSGIFNSILRYIGLGDIARPWLGTIQTAMGAVIIAHVWRFIGRSSLLFTANLATLPSSMMESAMLDGAGWWVRITRIVLPNMAPSFTVNILTSFMGSLKVFDIIYAMTDGGPANATESLGTYIIKLVRSNYNGFAAAGSVMLVVIILIVNRILVWSFDQWQRRII